MKDWKRVKIGDIVEPVRRRYDLEGTQTYPLLGVRLNGEGPFLREVRTGSEIAANSLFQVKARDFIYSRLFAWQGAFGVIPQELDGCYASGEFPTFSAREDKVEIEFLKYWFRLPDVLRSVESECTGSTPLTRNRYKEQFFLALEIPLPPLAEQRRIVTKIERLAGKIEEARGLREQAATAADTLVDSAARVLFGELVNSPRVKLKSVCSEIIDCLHSNPLYSDTGIPTVRSPDVGWGVLLLDQARRTSDAEYSRRTQRGEPQPGDIIIVREGGGTGKAGIVQEGQKLSLGQRVMQVRLAREQVLPTFFLYQWLSPMIQQDQIAERMKGSASPHLNIGAVKDFDFLLPPMDKQERVVSELVRMQGIMGRLRVLQTQTAAELDALLPAILDRAFKGEL